MGSRGEWTRERLDKINHDIGETLRTMSNEMGYRAADIEKLEELLRRALTEGFFTSLLRSDIERALTGKGAGCG